MLLGQILLRDEVVGQAELDVALETQVVYGGRLGTNLVELGFVRLDAVGRALVEQRGVPEVDGDTLARISPTALERATADDCIKLGCIPVAEDSADAIRVGMLDPTPENVIRLCTFFACAIKPMVVPELRFHFLLERFYKVPRVKRFCRMPDGGEQAPGQRQYVRASVHSPTGNFAPVRAPVTGETAKSGTQIVAAPVDLRKSQRFKIPSQLAVPKRATTSEEPAAAVYVEELSDDEIGHDTDIDLDEADVEFLDGSPAEEIVRQLNAAASGSEIVRLLVAPLFDEAGASTLFWVRGSYALGCCAEISSDTGERVTIDDRDVQQLAVELNKPSALQWALELRAALRIGGSDDATQHQIARFLSTPPPGQVCVAPVFLGHKVVNLLCAHSLPDVMIPDQLVGRFREVAEAAGKAYRRLQASIRK